MKLKTTFGQESHKIDYSSCEVLEEYRAKIRKRFSTQLPPNFAIAYKDKDSTNRIVKTEEDLIIMQNSDPKNIAIVKPNDSTEESSSDSDSDSAPYIHSCLELRPDCPDQREGRQLSDDEDLEEILETKKRFQNLSVSSILSQESEEDDDIQEIVVSKVATTKAQTAQKTQIPSNLQNKKDKNVFEIVDETQEVMQAMRAETKKNKKKDKNLKPQSQPQEVIQVKKEESKPKKAQKPQETTQNHQDPLAIGEEAKKRIRTTVLGGLFSSLISEGFAKSEKRQEILWKSSQDFQKRQFEVQSLILNGLKPELTILQDSQKENSEKINTLITALQDLQKSTQEQTIAQKDTLAQILQSFIKPDQTPPNPNPQNADLSQSKKKEESKMPDDPNPNQKPKEEKKKRKFAEKRKKSPSSSPTSSSDSSESDGENAKRKDKKKMPDPESSDSSSDSESESPKRKPKNQKQPKRHQDNFFKRAPDHKDGPSSFFGKAPNRSDNGKQKHPHDFHSKPHQDEKPKKKPVPQEEIHYRVESEEGGTNPERIFPYAAKLFKSVLLKNTGPTAWPNTCKLIHKEGVKGIEGQTETKAPSVKPGDLVPITLELEGPSQVGCYSSVWKLTYVNKRGKTEEFGEPIRVNFNVIAPEEESPESDDSDNDEEIQELSQAGDDFDYFTDSKSKTAPVWGSEKEKNDMIKYVVSVLDDSARPEIEKLVTSQPKKTRDEYIEMYFQQQNSK